MVSSSITPAAMLRMGLFPQYWEQCSVAVMSKNYPCALQRALTRADVTFGTIA